MSSNQAGNGPPVAFYDLPRGQYPFRIRLIRSDTDEVLQEIMVRGLGAVKIDSFQHLKVPVVVETTFANGHQYRARPGAEVEFQIVPPLPV